MQMGQRPDLRSAWRRGRYVVWNQRRILSEMPILDESDRAYIRSTEWKERDKIIAEYKARHEQKPDSLAFAYLYGLTLVGRQSKEAIKLFNGALEKDPKFPWPHLSLVNVFSSEAFLNKEE